MIVLDMPQGSESWVEARLGVPSASCFAKIVSPTGKPSAQADAYLAALLAERLTGLPCVTDADTPWMQRGGTMEDEARRYYAMLYDVEPRRVGFILNDGLRAGCSPDSLVGEDV